MKKNKIQYLLAFVCVLLCACDGIDLNIHQPSNDTTPVLTTLTVSSITDTTSVCGGNITNDGGSKINSQGICYSRTSTPTLKDSVVVDKFGLSTFSCKLTHLKGATAYFVRAYATNSKGTSYGNVVTFSTANPVGYPVLSTNFVSMITTSSVVSGGVITSDGGSPIISKGVCWGKNTNPTIQDSVLTDATVLSTFVCQLNHLTPNTSYYIRSFATNIKGTSYGNQVSFTSLQVILPPSNTVTDIDGNVYKTVTIGTQTWMAENLRVTHYLNGEPIPNVTADANWKNLSTGAYCSYKNTNSIDTITKFGVLYNWYVVNDTRQIAPNGWHMATESEWNTLIAFATANAGISSTPPKALAASTEWYLWGDDGTPGKDIFNNNSTGFTGMPGGYRLSWDTFGFLKSDCFWWTSTNKDANNATYVQISYANPAVIVIPIDKKDGMSIRCIKD